MFNSRTQNAKHAKLHEDNTNEPSDHGNSMYILHMTRLMGLCGDGICKHRGALNILQVSVLVYSLLWTCSIFVFPHGWAVVDSSQKFWKPMENVPSHKVVRLRTNRPLEFAGNEPLCQVKVNSAMWRSRSNSNNILLILHLMATQLNQDWATVH